MGGDFAAALAETIAAAAAVVFSAEPRLSAAELFGRLRCAARDLGRAPACQGAGRLDARAVLGGREPFLHPFRSISANWP